MGLIAHRAALSFSVKISVLGERYTTHCFIKPRSLQGKKKKQWLVLPFPSRYRVFVDQPAVKGKCYAKNGDFASLRGGTQKLVE